MLKLSSFSMYGTCSNSRKRKRRQKGIDDDLSANEQNSTDNIGIDKLPNDLLIDILSRMSLEEAARTSVLSRRWTYLWTFAFRNLWFGDRYTATGSAMKRKKFKSWVNGVLKFYQPRRLDSLSIRFSKIGQIFCPISSSTNCAIDSWIYFAIRKEVQRFELDFFDFSPRGRYEFPNIEKLLSHSHEVNSPFRSLRSLRLLFIDIKDEVVQYFLASCPHLERLCITDSDLTKNLKVVDSLPNLKVLEIIKCRNIQSLEISAVNLVSFTYLGSKISLPFKKIPNLCELTLGDALCDSFIFEPNEHSSYSVQLVKLVLNLQTRRDGRAIIAPPDLPLLSSLKRLELRVFSPLDQSLLFFTSLIKAAPQLRKFSIKINYIGEYWDMERERRPFPEVSAAEAIKFDHKNLKVIKMVGCVGCSSEEKFLVQLLKIAPLLEKVVIDTRSIIDTRSFYYDVPSFKATRIESKERAKHLASTFPQEIKFVVR